MNIPTAPPPAPTATCPTPCAFSGIASRRGIAGAAATAAIIASVAGSPVSTHAWQPADPPTVPNTTVEVAADEPSSPNEPSGSPMVDGEINPLIDAESDDEPPRDELGRRPLSSEPTTLAFKNVAIEQVIPFIVEATGKVVLPQPDVLSRRITILNDAPIPRDRALDLVFLALQQSGVGVVESWDLIMLRDLAEIDRQDVPVLGPRDSVLKRTDLGTIVEKVFALTNGSAENVGEIIKPSIPSFAKLNVDKDSNQIVIMGNIGLLQRMERLITSLDKPNAALLVTETFHLRYADAEQVAQNIRDLYSAGTGTQSTGAGGQNPFANFFRPGGQGQQGGAAQGGGGGGGGRNRDSAASGGTATSTNLRVTANTQQNSITVLAEPLVIEQVRLHIADAWDLPLPDEAVVPRIYELKNSDPVKVRDLLAGLFGEGSTAAAGGQGGGGGGGGGQGQRAASSSGSRGVGRLAGQFSFEAIPEAGRLVVVAKSPDNLAVIDKIIEGLDQPLTAGLPTIVELKHASAEELADQLNALLSQEGTLAQIPRQETGLSDSSSSVSPFAAEQSDTGTQQQQNTAAAGNIRFWWERARPPTTTSGSSNLVSKIRIVPVWRQNALMVMAPPEYTASVVQLVESLDRPGRQVLLAAIIVEMGTDDATALGLRWSSQTISPTIDDNSISIGGGTNAANQPINTFQGTKNDLLPGLFDTSVLNVGVNLNVLLQALSQKTKVNILSEPRIFTSDNQEAEFFSGQDIPFVTDTQTTDNGTLNETFDYRAVGLQLRVRPRITPKRDVDLRINLELSSIQPNQTLFGGFIVDRRETTTQLIVSDGQTVVVSGIMRAEDTDLKRKVPLLGDIPLLGALFTSIETTKTQTELIAFITPYVIENSEQVRDANQADRDRLELLREKLTPKDPDAPRATAAPPPATTDEPTPASSDAAPAAAPPTTKRRTWGT